MMYRDDIRNVAIIAHVDHGKTTLVDALLKQSHVFRENESVGELIMDSNTLEREKGITIMAKNTAVMYKNVKINIIDTPGHADFSGEVERVISMADGCVLLVDSVEGPMPQTKYVLRQAFKRGLKCIVVINKIDREHARVDEVKNLVQDLFLELATNSDQLDFPILYASGREGLATTDLAVPGKDITPIFDCILANVPPPQIETGPFQMMVSNLDYDNHKGKISIGRIWRGKVAPKDQVVNIGADGIPVKYSVDEVFTHLGLKRFNVNVADAGDIIALTGVDKTTIGDTIASPEQPEALPRIEIGEPTVEMAFSVNTSPFSGREGKYSTTRQLRARLYKELETNLSLRVTDTDSSDTYMVKGRGELHLAVLIETMRREGFEFEVSKPEAITKTVNGKLMEPVELLTIDTTEKNIGVLTEMLSQRQAKLTNMHNDGKGNVRIEYHIPTKGLLGFRSAFLTACQGEGVMNTNLIGYEPWQGALSKTRNGVLVSSETGTTCTYGIRNAEGRGPMLIEPGILVYEGMIVGLNTRAQDMPVNVCKEKQKTNMRSSTKELVMRLQTPLKYSLEQSIDFIAKDELLEITPQNIRMRKKILTYSDRLRDIAVQRSNAEAETSD
jgi:GTP-binding protein